MKELRKNELFENNLSFGFIYKDKNFNHNSILMSLSEAESFENVIYPVEFAPDMLIEVYPIIDVYWPLIYTNIIVFSTQITIEVCNNIYQNIYDPNNTHSPLEYFYLFFYNLNKDTQNILKYTTTNEYFLNKILEEPKEYLDEDIVDGFDIVNDMLPPHKHSDLISEICKDHLTLNKRPKEGKHKQRGGGHRRRRGGGHRDGSPSV
ncbi:hypothetical protein Mgra_00006558 [Meloidogyne graminicola]|uniref:Uncharacterized protein n=1 Tax=Meloidogyne graminicola TaxID=189291 RepID=A0A8S9ZKX6_9BILA|nr:hypothetical protein Mgra_00006558 [Meloidogyne graminicola]